MRARSFVDTNILVYAHDKGSGARHDQAEVLVERLWRERSGVISIQVIQEFYVNVRRRAQNPIPPVEARRLVKDYLCWEVVINTGDSILEVLDFERRFDLSFWDAFIVQAANASGAKTLYSEDLNHGQIYGMVKVLNPFLARSEE